MLWNGERTLLGVAGLTKLCVPVVRLLSFTVVAGGVLRLLAMLLLSHAELCWLRNGL